MEPAISVRDLHRSYGETEAVRGLSFEVRRGEIFGLLGPNGAGKTTTIEILEGYRQRTSGEVAVLGADPGRPTRRWRERIGLVLQACELDPNLTVRETVTLYSSFYPAPLPVAETMGLAGLDDLADARVGTLSGGQRRRVDVAVGLAGDPELLFLDEPTTGFDPAARRAAWRMIRSLRELGKTVLLTTHYMDEAQRLADRVGIMRDGELVAVGTMEEIAARLHSDPLVRFRIGHGADPQQVLHQLASLAAREGVELADPEVIRPSLEEMFLELTDGDGRG